MAKDAVILLAGLQQEDLTRSVDSAARRLASAFDQEAVTEAAFRVEEGSQEDYGQTSQYKTRVVAISRQDHEPQPQTIADLYGFDYRQSLVSDLQTKRPINHLLGTFWILLANAPRLLLSIRRRSKKSADKWQVRFGMLVYFILFVYFLLIVGAAAGSVATVAEAQMGDGVQESGQTGGNQSDADQSGQNAEDQTGLVGYLGRVSRPMQWVVVWVTAIGLFLRFDLKTWIEHSGRSITAASQYLAFDRRRSALADQFAALLNHIGEKEDEYRKVHVVAYSFGSIIALDALFPYDQPAGVFRSVEGLVTIGCPFDFIRTYWPDYFEGRKSLEDTIPKLWVNIYSAADVLSSDFLDQPAGTWRRKAADSQPQPTEAGVGLGDSQIRRPDKNLLYGRPTPLGQYGTLDKLSFVGFRMHKYYWEGDSTGCYLNIVRELYRRDPALA